MAVLVEAPVTSPVAAAAAPRSIPERARFNYAMRPPPASQSYYCSRGSTDDESTLLIQFIQNLQPPASRSLPTAAATHVDVDDRDELASSSRCHLRQIYFDADSEIMTVTVVEVMSAGFL